jgi:hypothetical protein
MGQCPHHLASEESRRLPLRWCPIDTTVSGMNPGIFSDCLGRCHVPHWIWIVAIMTMIVISSVAMSVCASRFAIPSELAAAALAQTCTNVEPACRDRNLDQVHPWLAGLQYHMRQFVVKTSGGFTVTRL